MIPPYLPALAALVAALSWVATGRVVVWLGRRAILDRPNARSSHVVPTPRGGGLGALPPILLGWGLLAFLLHGPDPLNDPDWRWPAVIGAVLLAAVSWRDDRGHVPVRVRLLAQLAAILPVAWLLPGPVAQGWLPGWLDLALAVVAWVWFANLYNFMDGIDGITGVETVALGCGLAAVAATVGPMDEAGFGLVLAAGAAGFLVWNWHPARVFLGDVGSVPFGYLAGGLLLALAGAGHWAAAVILPLYYLADATLTLLRRLARGEAVWRAHREHFYQRAVQGGLSHAAVAARVALADMALIGCALWSLSAPWPALLAAAAAVAALLVELGRRR